MLLQQVQQEQELQRLARARQEEIQRVVQLQAMQQHARESQLLQTMREQALQEQALRQQEQLLQRQRQTLQQQRQALEQHSQQQVLPQQPLQWNRSNSPHSVSQYIVPKESDAQALRNLQTENVQPNRSVYSQEFIDEIVRKVIQETRGEFVLPTSRDDIEKIVRKILQENSSNSNIMNRYVNNGRISNRNGLYKIDQEESTYPNASVDQVEQFNPQVTQCGGVSCGSSHENGPIAVAMANSAHSMNRYPWMGANSFSYTSV